MIRKSDKLAEILSKLSEIPLTSRDNDEISKFYVLFNYDEIARRNRGKEKPETTEYSYTGNDNIQSVEFDKKGVKLSKQQSTARASTSGDDSSTITNTVRSKICGKTFLVNAEEQNSLLALPDQVFAQVFVPSFSISLSLKIVEKVVYSVCKGYDSGRRNKLIHMATDILIPKLSSGTSLRDCSKMLEWIAVADPQIATEFVYLPLIKLQIVIPKPLLRYVDKPLLMNLMMTWMSVEGIELSSHSIQACNFLLDGKHQFDDQFYAAVLIVCRNSLRSRPDDVSVSHFFRSFIESHVCRLKPSMLEDALEVNEFNRSNNNLDIHNIIRGKLDALL